MDLGQFDFYLITLLFFIVAAVYSSVGHAGASGYTAVMALFSIEPIFMRPTSLMLNLVVGSIGLYRFSKADLVNFRKVFPFLIVSMPAAYWSAQLTIEKKYFYWALAIIFLISGLKLIRGKFFIESESEMKNIPLPLALIAGGSIGILSGLTGTGGAIFFTPLLLKMKWAKAKQASGLSVAFVFANSIFALAGIAQKSEFFNFTVTIVWVVAVALGAVLGSYWGVFKFTNSKVQKVLGAVIIIAAMKMLLNAV